MQIFETDIGHTRAKLYASLAIGRGFKAVGHAFVFRSSFFTPIVRLCAANAGNGRGASYAYAKS